MEADVKIDASVSVFDDSTVRLWITSPSGDRRELKKIEFMDPKHKAWESDRTNPEGTKAA